MFETMLLTAANIVLGAESQKMLSKMSLSDNTVKCRIDELLEQIKDKFWNKIKTLVILPVSAMITLTKLNALSCSYVLDLWMLEL